MQAGSDQDVLAGQAVYSPTLLALYDAYVLSFCSRWVWRCSKTRMLAHYNEHVSARHMDVGVGTGFFLDRCRVPAAPSIALVDLNENSLRAAASRIERYRPRSYRRNVLEPLDLGEERFDSVGANFLFHCVPGDFERKGAAFDHFLEYLNPGGVVFGATVVQGEAPRSAAARALMSVYNRHGFFHNREDTAPALEAALARRFGTWGVEMVGCAALFWAKSEGR